METETIIIVSVFGGAWLLLLLLVMVLFVQVASLRKRLADIQATGRLRVQKLKMNPDKNYAFNNPSLVPDEELSRRGYSMYVGAEDDVESGRPAERQTGGQFVEELTRELDHRQQRRANAPPFLLHSVEDSKNRALNNPVASRGKQSDTNPNFIY
ncbi:PREDICTED: uncharacterized protein LOC106122281 isoform X2 [Papilio xuthus]|uniref:Uncharacterized protein LOC106122281 isoform X1 n=1 Tax=Papilio xuthus TaxID=66420 RepID=A0AAJ7EE44_PAPXU|nr:PREDICTED: uncharacterized protein LOC106122281 isoform X1 [Papilio xuthus]XP_013173667.1 PREDICTED: uncharacterized protein LOC106122281 isoform X2 [Papilio xuthus]